MASSCCGAALIVATVALVAPPGATTGPATQPPSCPVTAPTPYRAANGAIGHRYGNRRLYTLPPTSDGTIRARPGGASPVLRDDGSVASKFPWFSTTERGVLRVSGRRLDAPAPPMRQRFPRRSRFWPTGIRFPTLGCWKVNARVNDVRIAFVVSVVAAEAQRD